MHIAGKKIMVILVIRLHLTFRYIEIIPIIGPTMESIATTAISFMLLMIGMSIDEFKKNRQIFSYFLQKIYVFDRFETLSVILSYNIFAYNWSTRTNSIT